MRVDNVDCVRNVCVIIQKYGEISGPLSCYSHSVLTQKTLKWYMYRNTVACYPFDGAARPKHQSSAGRVDRRVVASWRHVRRSCSTVSSLYHSRRGFFGSTVVNSLIHPSIHPLLYLLTVGGPIFPYAPLVITGARDTKGVAETLRDGCSQRPRSK